MLLELLFNTGLVAVFTYAYFFIGASTPKADGPGWGAAVWPQIILIAVIALLLVNMYQVYRKGAGKTDASFASLRQVGIASLLRSKLFLAMTALVVYALSLQAAGFILSTLVFFAAYAKIVGQKSTKMLLLSSFVATFAVYFVFSRALGVMLPRGYGILRNLALFLESL